MRRLVVFLALTSLIAGILGIISPAAQAGTSVGEFEIDGNLVDDPAGGPIDWSTPPPSKTDFTDATGSGDDSFNQGSKETQPAGWKCATGSAPQKDDLLAGQIAFRKVGTDQFVYVDYTRKGVNGDAHIDYEFSKSSLPGASCPALPQRSNGDVVITFDTENGGATIMVSACTWNGNASTGSFNCQGLGPQGGKWDGAVNIPNTIPGHTAGDFGEAALNLSQTIGTIACGQFSQAYMKTRSSTGINSALQDRTSPKPINVGDCPSSSLAKAVRNVTAGEQFTQTGPTTTSASPGNIIEYRLVYSNTGAAAATNVVVTDTIQPKQTFLSCPTTPVQCSVTGNVVTWNLGTVAAGGSVILTFQVRLDAAFPAGPTAVKNIAGVDTTEETPKTSNETTVNVTATPNSSLDKAVRNETTNGSFGNTAVASPGNIIEYQLTFTNTGNVNLTNVVITDTIQPKQTFLNCTGGCTQSGSTLTWNIGTVNVGAAPVVVTFRVRLDASFPEGPTLVKNTALSTSTQKNTPSDETTVTVNTVVSSSLDKAVRNVTTNGSFANTANASPGNVIEYQLTYTNTGNVPLTNVVISDTIQSGQTFLSCPATPVPCSVNGNVVSWNLGTVDPGVQKILTFRVTLASSFPPGTTLVKNTAVSDSTEKDTPSDETTVTVTAAPNLSLVKSGSATGEQITWTITYTNNGNAAATGVTISDNIPAGTEFVSCTPTTTCTPNGSPVTSVTWTIGTVAANGGTGSVTLTVRLTGGADGCRICNVATISSPDQTGGARNSNQACVDVTPVANPAGAHASGNAASAIVQVALLGLDLTLPDGEDPDDAFGVVSAQSGIGSDSENDELLAIDVPPPAPGAVLHADLLRSVTTSTVSADPAEARAVSVGSAANVCILPMPVTGPCTVGATAVRGVASATATGSSVNVNSLGSAIEGLTVLGIPQAVYPGAVIDLDDLNALFGEGSYVAIYEESKSTATPSGTSGGTYEGDIKVNMIHVHVTSLLTLTNVEVVVGQAAAHADFPQTTLCGAQTDQAVSGHAFMASLQTDPSILPLMVGLVEIPTSGGNATNSVNSIAISPVLTSKAATTSTQGSFSSINTTATSSAEVKGLCLLEMAGVCTIKATLVRSQANSTATGLNRTSDSQGTDFLGLKIAATTISLPVPPNTVIPLGPLGFVILNEQFCDNGGTFTPGGAPVGSCSGGTVAGHTGITVRAIRLVILDPAADGDPGAELIVAEAHSDAKFV